MVLEERANASTLLRERRTLIESGIEGKYKTQAKLNLREWEAWKCHTYRLQTTLPNVQPLLQINKQCNQMHNWILTVHRI